MPVAPPKLERLMVSRSPFRIPHHEFRRMIERPLPGVAAARPHPALGLQFRDLIREPSRSSSSSTANRVKPDSATVTMSELRAPSKKCPICGLTLGAILETRTVLFLGVDVQTIENICDAIGLRGRPASVITPSSGTMPGFRNQGRALPRPIQYRAAASGPPERTWPTVRRRATHGGRRIASAIASGQRGDSLSAIAPASVQRLSLKNLGPFRQAVFDFTKPWTLILGNNGSANRPRCVRSAWRYAGPTSTRARPRGRCFAGARCRADRGNPGDRASPDDLQDPSVAGARRVASG